jgi:hypothetical protein
MACWSIPAKTPGEKLNLEEHLAKAARNWAFLTQIEEWNGVRDFRDWSAIVLFYSALHLMDAYLHANGRDHGRSHGERNLALVRLTEDRRLSKTGWDSYSQLESRARALRYWEMTQTRQEYETLLVPGVRRIEEEVRGRLRIDAFAPLPFGPSS